MLNFISVLDENIPEDPNARPGYPEDFLRFLSRSATISVLSDEHLKFKYSLISGSEELLLKDSRSIDLSRPDGLVAPEDDPDEDDIRRLGEAIIFSEII